MIASRRLLRLEQTKFEYRDVTFTVEYEVLKTKLAGCLSGPTLAYGRCDVATDNRSRDPLNSVTFERVGLQRGVARHCGVPVARIRLLHAQQP
jgi:hypothetical protein